MKKTNPLKEFRAKKVSKPKETKKIILKDAHQGLSHKEVVIDIQTENRYLTIEINQDLNFLQNTNEDKIGCLAEIESEDLIVEIGFDSEGVNKPVYLSHVEIRNKATKEKECYYFIFENDQKPFYINANHYNIEQITPDLIGYKSEVVFPIDYLQRLQEAKPIAKEAFVKVSERINIEQIQKIKPTK